MTAAAEGRPVPATGWAVLALAVWTLIAVRLNAFFVEDMVGTFDDPQGYVQERDALRRGAVALYTAGVHAGHGLALFLGFALGLRQASTRAAVWIAAAAGSVLALVQTAVAVPFARAQLARWDEGGDFTFAGSMLGDRVVALPVVVCLVLYPLLAMAGGRLGAGRAELGWPGGREVAQAGVAWVWTGPFYVLILNSGPADSQGLPVVAMVAVVPLMCLGLVLTKLSAAGSSRLVLMRVTTAPAEVREAASVVLARPAPDVWAFVWDPASSVVLFEGTELAVTLPGTPPGLGEIQAFVESTPAGRTGGLAEVVELEPGRRAVTRSLAAPYPAWSTVTVEPLVSGGCRLTQEFRVELPAGVLARAVPQTRKACAARVRAMTERLSTVDFGAPAPARAGDDRRDGAQP